MAHVFLEPEPDQMWHSSHFTGKPTAYPNTFIKCIFCCIIVKNFSGMVSSLWGNAFLEPEPGQLWHSLTFTGTPTEYPNTYQMYHLL